MSHIVITGGNGFIGSHITEYLLGQGETVIHPSSKELNILDKEALLEAFKGADTVIHNAAKAADWGSFQEFYQVNVLGTRNVLHACLKNRVRQVIMTGSCSVFGEEHHVAAKNEDSPRNSHYPYLFDRVFPCGMNYYRDTKRIAAVKAADFAARHRMNLTILHPVWVYGEREFHTGFYEYLQLAGLGLPAIMGSRSNDFHVIYAGDLAKAYYLAFKSANQGVAEYIVGEPETVKMDTVYRLFCQAAGFKKPRNLPKGVVYLAAFGMELWYTLRKKKEVPLLTRGRVNMFYDSICYSTEKIRKELGFSCEYSLVQGISRTVKWYKENGYL